MSKKIYDVDKILYLYEKYGSLTAVRMRLGYAPATIKKILLENEVEIKKYIPARWDIDLKQKSQKII